MDLGLSGKRFVIGGGSRGLGRATAAALVAEGAHVLLLARDDAAVTAAAQELGPNAHGLAFNMEDPGAIDRVAAAVDDKLGGLDGILVNAGGPPPGEVLSLTDEQWLQSFELLIGGPIRLLRTLVPKMNNEGAILFITSVSVRQPIPNLDSSNVLRPGVAAMAKVLSRELGPGIRVNSIAPGRFDTERIRQLDENQASLRNISIEQQQADMNAAIPLGRYGKPEELGSVAAFLLSPAASYVSGVSVQLDGSMVTAIP